MRLLLSGSIAVLTLMGSMTLPAIADETTPTVPTESVDVATAKVPAVTEATAKAAERADEDAADLVAELPARRTDDFGLVGVTWTRGFDTTGMTVQVRLRTDGAWADWEELHVEVADDEGGRGGTEPLWAGTADGVAVRVTSPSGERPGGLSVATIDPGTSPTTTASPALYDPADAADAVQAADGSPTYTPRPAIISRSSWGAKKNTYCDSPRTGNETRGVVVHHTAGTNSYSKSQSRSIVRAVQAYHMKGRDWCDIGYNFLVDKYGQIFEGRVGGVDRAVRGAHAGHKTVNTYTMGVSMMGTFTTSQPKAATKTAMVKLIGWRLGTTFHPATGTYAVSKYRLNRIAAHRNVVSTACPGEEAYKWLSADGGLRDRVEAYVGSYSSDIKTRFEELGVAKTGKVYIGEAPFSADIGGRKARLGLVDLYSSTLGTFRVGGAYRVGYNATKAQSGALGVPVAEAQATARPAVKLQRFRKGAVYRVVRGGRASAYNLWGKMYLKYREIGEGDSAIGAPTTSQTRISRGRYRAQFAGGHMTLQSNGTVTVSVH